MPVEQRLLLLERQLLSQVRSQTKIEEGNLAVEIAFMSKSFAIFVAFQIQLFFYEQVMLHSSAFDKSEEWDRFWVRMVCTHQRTPSP